MALGFGKWVGKKILKSKKSTFIKDKYGTITGVKPGSKIGKKKTWKDHVDTSHPSYKKNWPPGN